MKYFQSIRWRLVASYVILTLLAVSLVGLLALSLAKQYIEQQEVEFLTANAEAVAHQAEPFLQFGKPPPFVLRELVQTAAFLGNTQVKILDKDRQVLADSGPQMQSDAFIWIRPNATHDWIVSETTDHAPLALEWQEFGVLNAEFPAMVIMSDMVDVASLSDSLAMAEFPTEMEVIKGHRIGGIGGYRFMFDDSPMSQVSAASITMKMGQFPANKEIYRDIWDSALPQSGVVEIHSEMDAENFSITDLHIDRSSRIMTFPIGSETDPMGYVELSNGPNLGSETLGTMRQALLFAALGVMAIAILVGLFMSRTLMAPLQSLMDATGDMRGDNLTARVTVNSSGEIGELARRFNQMADRLETSFAALASERDALRRFIADASHEFRTPITALKNFNELLQDADTHDSATRMEFLAESAVQLDRLTWISHNLLDISRLDSGLVQLDLAPYPVCDMLESIVNTFTTQMQEKQINLDVHLPNEPLTVYCDP
ncbi:MAG: HAMP domain-containing sensor histidine kinase, partial [Chloroflexota bacterium]